ncbi:MAG: hypothetical protein WKG00_16755 [Polyangiaceae bacterium]
MRPRALSARLTLRRAAFEALAGHQEAEDDIDIAAKRSAAPTSTERDHGLGADADLVAARQLRVAVTMLAGDADRARQLSAELAAEDSALRAGRR